MNKLSFWKGVVYETALGDNGRSVKVDSIIAKWDVAIPPMLDGVLKLPVPAVDDSVLVFAADEYNQVLFYLPVDYVYSNLTGNQSKLQLENTQGSVEVDGTEVLLGANATEYVALSNLVKSEIEGVVNTILGWTPVPNDGGAALKAAFAGYTVGSVASTKTKSE